MEIKDYYKILELEPPASVAQIKQAYRRLAQQYHPDKNSGKEYAAVYFAEIKEAYEVLTNPAKKEEYLQQRWYLQSIGIKKFSEQPVTPPLILKQLLELSKYIRSLDTFRMDKQKIFTHVSTILSDNNVASLKTFNEKDVNFEITKISLQSATYLEQEHFEIIAYRLKILNKTDTTSLNLIAEELNNYRKKRSSEKYKPLYIIIITILVCAVIYVASR